LYLTLHPGIICPPGSLGWNAEVDQLNAAQTGALASNLLHEVNDYLIPQVKKWNIPRESFKYINLQIGSNDQCWLCAQANLGIGPGSPDDFESNVRATLEALRAAIREYLL
jgi:phospholipase B1